MHVSVSDKGTPPPAPPDASDKLVCCSWSCTRPSSTSRKPPLLLTATASGSILTWGQQPPHDDRRVPSSLQHWYASALPDLPLPNLGQPQEQQQQHHMLHSVHWLAPPSSYTWRPEALQDFTSSTSYAPARIESYFCQPTDASAAAAPGFGCDWLSRSSLAFAAVTKTGLVVLFWARLGREGSLAWRHTSPMALPFPALADTQQQQQELISAAFMTDGPASLKIALVLSSHPQTVQIVQMQGDPIFAAAAVAGVGGQVLLQVTPHRQLHLAANFHAAALAFRPCLGSSRDVALAVVSTNTAPAAAGLGGGSGGDTGTATDGAEQQQQQQQQQQQEQQEQQEQQQQQELKVETYLLPGGGNLVKEEAGALLIPSASYSSSSSPVETSSRSCSSYTRAQCWWSPDCSWLAVTGGGAASSLMLDGDGLRPLPLTRGGAAEPSLHSSKASCSAIAAAPSPSGASVAVLYQSMSPAATCSSTRLAIHPLGLLGGSSNNSSNATGMEDRQKPQQVALAAGRVLWCLLTGAHHWDVVQQLVRLGRNAAASQASTPTPGGTSSRSSSGGSFSLPAVMACVDHKVQCHPYTTRLTFASKWDAVKLAVLMMVPGQEAASLSQELYLRGMAVKGLGGLREVVEAALSELVGGSQGLGKGGYMQAGLPLQSLHICVDHKHAQFTQV
jgi:hypothetical protein